MISTPFYDKAYSFKPSLSKAAHTGVLDWFLQMDISEYISMINSKKSTYWMRKSQQRAVDVFQMTAARVPAYQDFLAKNKVDPKNIQTFDDFEKYVPLMDKKNYISQYSLEQMSIDGEVHQNSITSFSSGTSGAACYWPRSAYQNIEGAFQFEEFLTSVFQIDKKKSLIVSSFALGNYVAGTYVLSCLELLALKGYQIMIVTPGINQEDSFRMITKLAPLFEQTILCGYPPLLRDMIKAGDVNKVDWQKINLKFLFSSELFTETWRQRVLEESSTPDNLRSSTNLYGTADATLFGLEHPINQLIRKEIATNTHLSQELFDSLSSPTFVQYNPFLRYFEVVDGELVLTVQSGIPLIRYNLHDKGGVLSHEKVMQTSLQNQLNISQKLKQQDCEDTLIHFPHVYVFGRSDGSVSFYGLLLYPEHIRAAIEHEQVFPHVSGKFVLDVIEDDGMNPSLYIHIELAQSVEHDHELEKRIFNMIFQFLREKSAEYNRLVESLERKAHPRVILHPFGKQEMFQLKIKQTWIKRS